MAFYSATTNKKAEIIQELSRAYLPDESGTAHCPVLDQRAEPLPGASLLRGAT
jgi:hypothetical protein